MAKLIVNLADKKLRAEISSHKKKADKAKKVFDGGGLYLYRDSASRTYWRFSFRRPVSKKYATMSLGVYPIVTLAMARKMRDEYRELLA